ncbi:MAG: Usg family protein [Proteobacteria bacterium]|nr:Usg family protein [Pseudomonadota bacterium]
MGRNLWIEGYRLTTAEITYRLPDHPGLLQTYVWQDLDLAPQFPVLSRFLTFWEKEIEGELHSVTVGTTELVTPAELKHANLSLSVH